MNITELLARSVEKKASDLHISMGLHPILRVDGDLQPQEDMPIITPELGTELFNSVMDPQVKEIFATKFEADFAIEAPNVGRFRVNVYKQKRGMSGAFRTIPERVISLTELNMPPVFYNLANLHNGIVLVTGPTGSGKSTTLAALIDHINQNQPKHIITIEDPVEFMHSSKKSLVHQREVSHDTLSFNNALRAALREDPDIILVGELRDIETIRLALTAAETGHLVFATLHTSSAAKTINRIVDVFPENEKLTVRTMLGESLQAVISQTLLKKNGGGRVAALEIMVCTGAIRNLIREGKVAQMYSTIQTGMEAGMQTLDRHLSDLVNNGIIAPETAREVAVNKEMF